MPPGTSLQTGPTTQQYLDRRDKELKQTTGEAIFEKDFQNFTAEFQTAIEGHRQASAADDSLEAMEPHMNLTGKATPLLAAAGGWLSAFGMAPDKVRDFVSSAESLGALINERVINNSTVLKGNLSNRDMEIVQKSFMALGNTPEANAFIMDVMRAVNEKAKLRAELMAEADAAVRSREATVTEAKLMVERELGGSIFDRAAMQRWNYLKGTN